MLVYLAFFLSGFAALLYQVVWERLLALFSGSDVRSAALVVAAFLAGLGLGSLGGSRLADRLSAAGAVRLYAAGNVLIGLYALASRTVFYDLLFLRLSTLAWSRALWAEFVLDLSAWTLPRSLSRACDYFGGSAREWLFDNPKIVVLERHGSAARFHPLLLDLAGRHAVRLRLCGVRKGNEKGRVERQIRYIRERFLAARTIRSIDQGNRDLLVFLDEVALPRPHPTLPGRTVRDCLDEERARLLPLPARPVCTDQVVPVHVDKTAFCRFDTNVYSVAPEHVRKTLTLSADDRTVRLLDNTSLVASHPRCWGRRQVVEAPEHREAIIELKKAAKEPKGRDRLRAAVPGIDVLYERWVEVGRNLGSMTARTLKLLDLYGAELLATAVQQVLERGLHDPGALASICEQHRRAQNAPVPLDLPLASHVHDRDVIPHALETYDEKPKKS